MALSDKLIKKYKDHKKDTGSVGVQIVLLTEQISELVNHLKDHKKDQDSRRSLIKMINKRRKLLNYLSRTEPKKYQQLVADLKLKNKGVSRS